MKTNICYFLLLLVFITSCTKQEDTTKILTPEPRFAKLTVNAPDTMFVVSAPDAASATLIERPTFTATDRNGKDISNTVKVMTWSSNHSIYGIYSTDWEEMSRQPLDNNPFLHFFGYQYIAYSVYDNANDTTIGDTVVVQLVADDKAPLAHRVGLLDIAKGNDYGFGFSFGAGVSDYETTIDIYPNGKATISIFKSYNENFFSKRRTLYCHVVHSGVFEPEGEVVQLQSNIREDVAYRYSQISANLNDYYEWMANVSVCINAAGTQITKIIYNPAPVASSTSQHHMVCYHRSENTVSTDHTYHYFEMTGGHFL